MAEVKNGGERALCEGRRHCQLTEQVGRMTAVRFPQTVIYRRLNITGVDFLKSPLGGRMYICGYTSCFNSPNTDT